MDVLITLYSNNLILIVLNLHLGNIKITHLVSQQLLVLLILRIILCAREHTLNGNKLPTLILVNILLNVAIQSHLLILCIIRIIQTGLVIEQISSNQQTTLALFGGGKNILDTELAKIHLLLGVPITGELACNHHTPIVLRKILLQVLNHVIDGDELLPTTTFLTKINNVLTITGNLINNFLIETVIPINIHLLIVGIHCLNCGLNTIKSLNKCHI